MSEDLDSTSFNKNYRILKETADWLSQQKEPDIDQLVPKVEKAMKAYQICEERLEKVQTTLGQYFPKDPDPDAPDLPSQADAVANKPTG
jgi:exodeoxyribonuclease VII small subunit